jgi:hypothetical protein
MRNLMIATALLCVVALGCNKKENVMPAGTPAPKTTPAPSYKNVPWTPLQVYYVTHPVSGITFENHVLDNFSYQLYLNGGCDCIKNTYWDDAGFCSAPAHNCTNTIVIRPQNWAPTE